MNRKQELLVILNEECGEVIQAASKVLRFGLSDSNRDQLEYEMGDLLAMMKLVDEEWGLSLDRIFEHAENKLKKVEQYMQNPRND